MNIVHLLKTTIREPRMSGIWFKAGLMCMFLFFVAIKGEWQEGNEMVEAAELPQVFIVLKDLSLVLIFFIFALQFKSLHRFKVGVMSNSSISWLLMLVFYYLRMYIDAPDMMVKLVSSFLIYLWIANYFGLLSSESINGNSNVSDVIYYGIFGFSLIYSTLSAFLFIQGFGVLSFSGRFVGLSGHPNFVGMAVSISLSISLYAALNAEKAERYLGWIGVVCALYVLVGSASRTAVVSGIIGVIFVFVRWIKDLRSVGARGVILGLTIFLILLATVASDIGTAIGLDAALERLQNADNTRQDVWEAMLVQIVDNPIFGVGADVVASESSFLRITAASGIFVGMWFLVNLVVVVLNAVKNVFARRYRGDILLIVLFQIVVSSFAEGYLAEFLGLMPILFVLLIAPLNLSKTSVVKR